MIDRAGTVIGFAMSARKFKGSLIYTHVPLSIRIQFLFAIRLLGRVIGWLMSMISILIVYLLAV